MREGGTILALDLATACGLAEGTPGGDPRASSQNFSVELGGLFGAGEKALMFFSDRLTVDPPAAIFIERPGLHSIGKAGTSFQALFRLFGLIFLAGVIARCQGIYDVRLVEVKDVRKHFLGGGGIAGADAKRLTQARCRELGWSFKNPDEADALAVWDFACEQVKPGTGHPAAPGLFKVLAVQQALTLKSRAPRRVNASAARKLFAKKRGAK